MGGEVNWIGRTLHLVGVGGAGMSGLARIALQLGATVSGSDRAQSRLTDALAAEGVRVSIGHDAKNVPEGAEIVFSSAVSEENPERERGFELGLRQLHRSELLGELTSLRPTIAVTGTHGKTTTTAMVVAALRGAGLDPAWYVGAELAGGEPGAGWGTDPIFVVEADESDRSLLALQVDIAVLTNCELDHHATYSSLEDLRATMRQFLSGTRVAVVWDRPDLLELACDCSDLRSYDAPDAVSSVSGAAFSWNGRKVKLAVPGVHNAINAAGALEAVRAAGVIDSDGSVEGIESFVGTARRFQIAGKSPNGALIVDDYAHHPTEVAATIAAARSMSPSRVVVVFQPHLYSRTAAFAEEFGEALAAADAGLVLDIYEARESAEDFPGVDSALVVTAANAASGREAFAAGGPSASAADAIARLLVEGDICLLLGAGDVGSIAAELVE